MSLIQEIKEQVLQGNQIAKAEALQLYGEPLEELCLAADEIRYQFCGNRFDLCTIINGKSGRCSENCKYCAQSACYHTEIEEYPLLAVEKIKEQAKYNEERGVLRYSIVTSGKALNDTEVEHVCESVREIHKESKIKVCVSGGLLNETQFRKLKQAGVTRVHNNLETSRQNFPNVCTTHTYEQRVNNIHMLQRLGFEICSGGIIGMGESKEDIVDMLLDLREIQPEALPINFLLPIPGTPLENADTSVLTPAYCMKVLCLARLMAPQSDIRCAAGREVYFKGREKELLSIVDSIFASGYLTADGQGISDTIKTITDAGFTYEIESD